MYKVYFKRQKIPWIKFVLKACMYKLFTVFCFRLKSNPERARELRHWQNTGGVLIMGYEMFRNLTAETAKKFRAKMKKDFQETLVDPGMYVNVQNFTCK